MVLTKVDEIVESFDCDESSLVMILQDVQEALNYLPAEAIGHVAKRLGLGLGHVYNVATFYSSFSLVERGKNIIKVCDGTACHLRGAVNLLDEITRQLDINEGETTPDKLFTLETVACLGACALAPVMAVGSQYHGQLTTEKLRKTLDEYRETAVTDVTG